MSKRQPTKEDLWCDLSTLRAIIAAHVPIGTMTERERRAFQAICETIDAEDARPVKASLWVPTEYDF